TIEALLLDVADHADDGLVDARARRVRIEDLHLLADRILAGEEPARERLVDQAHRGGVTGVRRQERAALDQARAHGRDEVIADDLAVIDGPGLAGQLHA